MNLLSWIGPVRFNCLGAHSLRRGYLCPVDTASHQKQPVPLHDLLAGSPLSISTSILAAACQANDADAARVADWYGVAPRDVEQAVAFERQRSSTAA